MPIGEDFSRMTLSTDGGHVGINDIGSQRLATMTQRVMERQTVTTSSESRSEKKSQQHSFRLD